MQRFVMRIAVFLLLALPFVSAHGQGYYISPYVWQNLQKVSLENPLSFIDYAYDSPYLDMRNFQMRNPKVGGRIPEYVEIKLPKGIDKEDLYYSVAYISSPDESTGVLVLFLIENYNGDHPVLYIDRNLNRDFGDDDTPVVFKKSHQIVHVHLKHEAKRAISFHFSIVGPDIDPDHQKQEWKEPDALEPASKISRKRSLRLPPWLSFNFDIGYALGRVRYSYQNLSTGYPVNYTVTSNHKGFRAGMGVHLKDFRLSATAGFNHFFYWTSYKIIRLGEPYFLCDPQCTRYENVEEQRNRDLHPKVRWDFGAQLAWEPYLTKDIRLGPFIEPQIWMYSGGVYQEKVIREYRAFEFGPDPALRTGIAFWVKAGKQSFFRIEFSAAWSRFQPVGFYEGVNHTDDQQRSLGLHLGFGF